MGSPHRAGVFLACTMILMGASTPSGAQYPGNSDLGEATSMSSSSSSSGGGGVADRGTSGTSGASSAGSSSAAGASSSGADAGADSVSQGVVANNGVTSAGQSGTRQRALLKQFRLEFAERIIIERATQADFAVHKTGRYLDQFAKELEAGLSAPADLKSLGLDLALLREAVDQRLDKVMASYEGGTVTPGNLFGKTSSISESVTALHDEVQRLALKNQLLVFGERSLQAMGYFAD